MSMTTEVHIVCPHCRSLNRVPAERAALAARCGACHEKLFEGRPFAVDPAALARHLAADSIPVLVDVWAPWCGPCRMMAPMFDGAARALEPEMRLLKLNADEAPDALARYGIRSIPTLLLFDRGRLVERQAGAMDEADIVRWVQSRLATAHADIE